MKIRLGHIAIAACSALCAFQVGAGEPVRLSPQFDRCIAASGSVTSVLIECQSSEWERQDKRLNLAYQKLLAKVPAQKKTELRGVQRAWIAYVEAKCKFYYDNDEFSGTLDRVTAQYCGVQQRALRAEELETFAER
jgi:uncharacterized protein YecT (DUF1311 family)